MLAGPGAGAAGAATVNGYGGTLDSGGPIALQLSPGTDQLVPLGRITFATPASCSGTLDRFLLMVNEPIVSSFNLPAGNALIGLRRFDGRFTARGARTISIGEDTGSVVEDLAGRIAGAETRGSYSARIEVSAADGTALGTCETGTVRWRARSAPGRIFAGATSDDQAVVIKLDRRGRQVRQMRIGSFLECGEAGGLAAVNEFSARLGADGRFADTDDYTAGGDRGRDQVRGRVRGIFARGTFRDRISTTAPDGSPVRCDTGRVTWRARTSR